MFNILAAYYGQNIEQINIIIVYLNFNIDVILYIVIPASHKIVKKICFFKKIIYRLKKSAQQQFQDLRQCIIKVGQKKLMLNYYTFIPNLSTTNIIIIIVYIDNFLFFCLEIIGINIVKFFLVDQYKIEDLGSYKWFMRIKLEKNLKIKIILLHQKFIQKKD